mmetsp:Transcript_20003/g.64446  ORF Transcript_20003/g.64446 Transcript_20003/m.64446 type:complete len:202 (-) Transcript_20003:446-1051(-)
MDAAVPHKHDGAAPLGAAGSRKRARRRGDGLALLAAVQPGSGRVVQPVAPVDDPLPARGEVVRGDGRRGRGHRRELPRQGGRRVQLERPAGRRRRRRRGGGARRAAGAAEAGHVAPRPTIGARRDARDQSVAGGAARRRAAHPRLVQLVHAVDAFAQRAGREAIRLPRGRSEQGQAAALHRGAANHYAARRGRGDEAAAQG